MAFNLFTLITIPNFFRLILFQISPKHVEWYSLLDIKWDKQDGYIMVEIEYLFRFSHAYIQEIKK